MAAAPHGWRSTRHGAPDGPGAAAFQAKAQARREQGEARQLHGRAGSASLLPCYRCRSGMVLRSRASRRSQLVRCGGRDDRQAICRGRLAPSAYERSGPAVARCPCLIAMSMASRSFSASPSRVAVSHSVRAGASLGGRREDLVFRTRRDGVVGGVACERAVAPDPEPGSFGGPTDCGYRFLRALSGVWEHRSWSGIRPAKGAVCTSSLSLYTPLRPCGWGVGNRRPFGRPRPYGGWSGDHRGSA